MLKIYGSMMCPDCVRCLRDLDEAGILYEYFDFSDSLRNLKVFLSHRDNNVLFKDIVDTGKIGIPCIVDESGAVEFSWDKYIKKSGL